MRHPSWQIARLRFTLYLVKELHLGPDSNSDDEPVTPENTCDLRGKAQ